MEVPKLDKVVINMGVGEAKDNAKVLESASLIWRRSQDRKPLLQEQRTPWLTSRSEKVCRSDARLHLEARECTSSLTVLVNLALPRVRDFRGVNPNAFDGRGNYALGIKEQLIFPEIEYDKIDKVRGMDVIFVTTAKTDEEARELLRLFNMPFAK